MTGRVKPNSGILAHPAARLVALCSQPARPAVLAPGARPVVGTCDAGVCDQPVTPANAGAAEAHSAYIQCRQRCGGAGMGVLNRWRSALVI